MKTLNYTVHIEPVEEGGFVVSVPALPGCHTQGETYEEAVAMARECIEGFLEVLSLTGQPIPIEPAPIKAFDALIQVHPALAV